MVKSINKTALLIFAKTPAKGKVKTRLIPGIGEEYSTRLYEELFHHTMNIALESDVNEIQIWCSPSRDAACFQNYDRYNNVSLYIQQGNDLGDRMFFALNKVLNHFDACVLIGCDCPDLMSTDINRACVLLEHSDVVLGPAIDGGYYMLASRKSSSRLFENIEWSTASVYKKTVTNLSNLGWGWQQLRTLSDIDETSDLHVLKKYKLGGYIKSDLVS